MTRKMPSSVAIRKHWAIKLLETKKEFEYENEEYMLNSWYCFGCGFEQNTNNLLQRAHILARADGGNDDVSNIHLLCRHCHFLSEYKSSDEYWRWFLQWGMTRHIGFISATEGAIA
jgi:hypothetical protein